MNKNDLMQYFDSYLKKTKDDWNYITPQQLHKQLKKDQAKFYLLDIRRHKDFNKGHIAGSINIFWLDLFSPENILKLPLDKQIVLICYVGHTSSQVLTLLKLMGYNVISLKFGIGLTPIEGIPVASWSQFGFPLEHHHCNSAKDGYCALVQQQQGGSYYYNLEEITLKNKNYRKVLTTTPNQQLVLMNIPQHTEIGMERHKFTTQFIKIEKGEGIAYIGNNEYILRAGDAILIPPNATHNVIATSGDGMKLYTIYSPPEHVDGLVQRKKP